MYGIDRRARGVDHHGIPVAEEVHPDEQVHVYHQMETQWVQNPHYVPWTWDRYDPNEARGRPRTTWRDLVAPGPIPSSVTSCYRQQWANQPRMYHMERSPTCRPWFRGMTEPDVPPPMVSHRSRPENRGYREPRSFSLERADPLRPRGVFYHQRDGHYTPPRKYVVSPSPPPRPKITEFPVDAFSLSVDDNGSGVKAGSDRPPCGPGPPIKQLRSHSVDTGGFHSHGQVGLGRTRQRSVSGSLAGNRKAPSRRLDEENLKRSRHHSNQYELSQDLLDKQVEMLERKYGGMRARSAALTIQRAFRKYCIIKRFRDIASASKGEKRLSRRLYSHDMDSKDNWSAYSNGHLQTGQGDVIYESENENAHGDSVLKCNVTTLYRELGETLDGEPTRRPSRSQSMRERRSESRSDVTRTENLSETKENGVVLQNQVFQEDIMTDSMDLALEDENYHKHMVWSPPSVPRHPAWTAVVTPRSSHLAPPSQYSKGDGVDTPRESLSSEDSAISSTGEGDIGSEERRLLDRHCSSRHSLTASSPVCSSIRPQDDIRYLRPTSRGSDVNRKVLSEQSSSSGGSPHLEDKRLSNISENSEDSMEGTGYSSSPPPSDMMNSFSSSHGYSEASLQTTMTPHGYKEAELHRKRQYRVGLNLFNKKPDRGIRYLIHRGFLEASPQAVARFLISRKGLSKQMIGDYLGNLQSSFNMAVLECFVQELDLAGMQVDVALRKFQTYFRLPGEAQKIERLMEVFSQRYVECNRDIASKFHNPDTVFVLAFAIIMLNTDLHTPNMKAEKRMKLEDFIKNLRGVDDGHDLDRDMLVGIYERIKANEFKPGSDHVTQVLKVQQTIVGKKPNLALPHRRLVCYCRLYEVYDVNKKERPGVHQREVFLFNDMIMVTKILSKKKNSITYTFRQSFPLSGMSVTLFEAPYYPHGIRLSQRVGDKVLITFNARNEHDRSKFVEDLKESILEMDEMENLRIEGELEKQKVMRARGGENRDSGVADVEIIPPTAAKESSTLTPEGSGGSLKRSALSNSLLDLHEQQMSKPVRRGSAGSLDSGMSISFQSSAASTVSHDSSPQTIPSPAVASSSSPSSLQHHKPIPSAGMSAHQQGFLGGLFSKKTRHVNKGNGLAACGRTTSAESANV